MRKITISQIIDAVCKEYVVNKKNISAPGKKRLFAEARAVAAVLVLNEERLSLTDLGKYLHRDLAALSRAASRIQDKLNENSEIAFRVAALQKKLL